MTKVEKKFEYVCELYKKSVEELRNDLTQLNKLPETEEQKAKIEYTKISLNEATNMLQKAEVIRSQKNKVIG